MKTIKVRSHYRRIGKRKIRKKIRFGRMKPEVVLGWDKKTGKAILVPQEVYEKSFKYLPTRLKYRIKRVLKLER